MSKETIDAMKNALSSLRFAANEFGHKEGNDPHWSPEDYALRDSMHDLEVAIAQEEEQTGERAATDKDYLIGRLRQPEKYFRFPEHITAALIEDCALAAEMLAADADAYKQGRYDESMAQGPSKAEWDGLPADDQPDDRDDLTTAYLSGVRTGSNLKQAQQAAVPQVLSRIEVTEEMHRAAVKVLHRASGLDGLPQRMLNAMLAAAPQPPQVEHPEVELSDGEIYSRMSKAIDARLNIRVPMTGEQRVEAFKVCAKHENILMAFMKGVTQAEKFHGVKL